MISMIKKYFIYGAVALSFAFGWVICSWHEDSKDLAVKTAQEAILKAMRETESDYAKTLEENLARLKANERVIENHTKEIIDRPVYRNICLDDDGVRIINSYALDNTAKLIGEMSRNATDN